MHLTRKLRNKNKKYVKRRSIRRTSQRGRGGQEHSHQSYGRAGVRDDRDIKVKVHGNYLLDGWKHLRQKFMIAPHETIGHLKQQIKERIRTMHNKHRYEFPLRLMLNPHPDQHSNIKDILTDEMTIGYVRDRYFNDEYDQYEINIKMSEGKYYGPDFSTKIFSRELGSTHPFKMMMKHSGIRKMRS
uniref:Uncharacterized protein n=1 Tax=viral metagenome TaxID=1070528 RepID=A0A6C0I660_9ZZZZ